MAAGARVAATRAGLAAAEVEVCVVEVGRAVVWAGVARAWEAAAMAGEGTAAMAVLEGAVGAIELHGMQVATLARLCPDAQASTGGGPGGLVHFCMVIMVIMVIMHFCMVIMRGSY